MKTDHKIHKILSILILTFALSIGMTALVMAEEMKADDENIIADISVTGSVTEDPASFSDEINVSEETEIVAADDVQTVETEEVQEIEEVVAEAVEASDVSDDVVAKDTDETVTDDVAVEDADETAADDVTVDEVKTEEKTDVKAEEKADAKTEIKTETKAEVKTEDKTKVTSKEEKKPSTAAAKEDNAKEEKVASESFVRVTDLIIDHDEEADAAESFVLLVNGKEYTVNVYSDGTYDGDIPEGFAIEDGGIVIRGSEGDLDVTILEHTAISAISWEPEFEVPFAPVVTVSSFESDDVYFADENGVVEIGGLFIEFDEGAAGSESFTMLVNGEEYSFTVYSDGSYDGDIPEGFVIENGILVINGLEEDMEIMIIGHTAISAISEEPDLEEAFFEGPVIEEPVIEEEVEADDEVAVTAIAPDHFAPAAYTVADDAYYAPAEETAGEAEEIVVKEAKTVKAATAAVEPEEEIEMGYILPEEAEEISEARVLGASSVPVSPAYFIIIAVLVLGAAAFVLIKRAKQRS